MSFPASYDTTAKALSVVVCIVLIGISFVTDSPVAAGLGLLLVCLTYAYSPRGYEISDRFVVVDRLIGSVRVPFESIREIRRATTDDLRWCIRLWGSGGMFGYFGLFRTSALGIATWYVTNRRNIVVVITDSKTVLFSPDNVDAFLAALPTTPSVITPTSAQRSSSGAMTGILIGSAIGILAITTVGFALIYSPGPPAYTLARETLQIHDRFYPVTVDAAAVDVANVRIVDFGVDRDWRPVMRTNGFANSNYRSGWFRVANGKTVRMYRAGSTRLVLLPAKDEGTTVLLEVPLPEKFIEDLRLEWSR